MKDVITTSRMKPPELAERHELRELTIADGIYLCILAAAAVLRFVDLSAIPLAPAEAEMALASWMWWQPESSSLVIGSPAYFTLTSLLATVVGYTDATVRLVPAVFGLATIALAWLLRQQVGQLGMLLFALFLAISPMNVVVARTVGGQAIAEFSLMLLLVAWLRYQQAAGWRWLYVAAAALGLGLATAPIFLSGLLTILVAGLIQHRFRQQLPDDERQAGVETAVWRRATIIGGAIFVSSSTLFLAYPLGLGASLTLVGQWLSHFSLPSSAAQLLDPLLAAGRYELLLLLPGAFAVLWAVRQDNYLATFCVYWLGAITVFTLLQPAQIENALWLTLPGYLLVALLANHVLAPKIQQISWLLATGLFLAGGLILINVARYSRVVVFQPQQLANIWMAVLIFAISAVTIYYAATWDPEAAVQGILLAGLALLAVYSWGTAWWLGHQAANDPRERWVTVATDDDVRILQRTVQDISRQVTGTDSGLEILSAVDSPVLHWYLRAFEHTSYVNVLSSDTRSPLLIGRSDSEPSLENDYVGADFGFLRTGWQPPAAPSQTPLLDMIRWWFFHDSDRTISETRLILWWRADLAQ